MQKETIKNNIIDETMYKCEFDNGLKAYIIPKKGYSKKYAIYSTKFGSIDSKLSTDDKNEVPDGIAHFLEHKMFTMPYGDAMEKLGSEGAYTNAYTSFDHTAYLFYSTENFEQSLKTLLDFVQTPYFPLESVENEKGIIGQEIMMGDDDPDWKVYFNFLKAMYKVDPIAKDIAGTCESISNITPELLMNCHKIYYHPSNMIICIVGDVNPDEIFNIIWQEQKNKEKMPEVKRPKYEEPQEISQEIIKEKMQVGMPMFMMGFKQDMKTLEEYGRAKYTIAMDLICDCIFGKSSNLYKQLYEEGLINGYLETSFELGRNTAYSAILGETKNFEKVKEYILKEIERIKKEGLSQKDFQRTKKMQIGSLIKSFNSVETIGQNFVQLYMKGIDMFDYASEYEKITFEDINEVFKKHFDTKKFAMSIVE